MVDIFFFHENDLGDWIKHKFTFINNVYDVIIVNNYLRIHKNIYNFSLNYADSGNCQYSKKYFFFNFNFY